MLTKSVLDKTDLKSGKNYTQKTQIFFFNFSFFKGFLNSYACVDKSDENEYMHLGNLIMNIFIFL